MKSFLWILVAGGALLGGASVATGQSTADAYFHEAAQKYVAGKKAAAKRAVEQGLEIAPSDPRLTALRDKLQQQEGRPRGQQDSSATNAANRSQNNTNSSSNSASEEGKSSPRTNKQNNQGDPKSGSQDQSTAKSSQPGQQSESFSPTDASPTRESGRRGRGLPRDTLSRTQAERLLRALEGEERQLLREIRTQSANPRSVEKDW